MFLKRLLKLVLGAYNCQKLSRFFACLSHTSYRVEAFDLNLSHYTVIIADVAISKRPLLLTVWTQLRLRSHQILYEIFTRKQVLPTSAGNAQAQLHFCE